MNICEDCHHRHDCTGDCEQEFTGDKAILLGASVICGVALVGILALILGGAYFAWRGVIACLS